LVQPVERQIVCRAFRSAKRTGRQKTSHPRVAWDLIRFDINRNNDTISTARQQNSHKEITT